MTAAIAPETRAGAEPAPTAAPVKRGVLPPGWPLTFLLVGYPVFWLLGLSGFALEIAAVPMAVQLVRRSNLRVPRGFGIWLMFLLVSFLGVLVLGVNPPDTVPGSFLGRIVGFSMRESGYLAATVLLLYVGNLRRELPDSKIIRSLAVLFVWTVLGGVLALVWPNAAFTSPLEMILPRSVTSAPYVQALVHPAFAQVQDFAGDPLPRPAAPFVYTNMWGFQIAVLAIWFVVWMIRTRSRTARLFGAVALSVGLVTILYSLNRGVWLGVLLALVYLTVALVRRGHALPLLALLLTVGAATSIAFGTPARQTVETRLANGHSDEIRGFTSQAAIDLAVQSPIVGYGSTRSAVGSPSSIAVGKSPECPKCGNVPIGINGYLFNLLVTTGIVGAALFFAFWVSQLRRSRGDPSLITAAARMTIVVSMFFGLFYDLVPLVPFIALGLMWRQRTRSVADAGTMADPGTTGPVGSRPRTRVVHDA